MKLFYQLGIELDVGVLLQQLKPQLSPALLADPRRPLLRQDVVASDLAEAADHLHLGLGPLAQLLDVVLARVLELEGEFPILEAEDLPVLDGGGALLVHAFLFLLLQSDQALQDVALVFVGHLKLKAVGSSQKWFAACCTQTSRYVWVLAPLAH